MRSRWMLTVSSAALAGGLSLGTTQGSHRLNPVVELLANKQPVFGVYAPRNARAGGRGGGRAGAAAPGRQGGGVGGEARPTAPPNAEAPKTPAELAAQAMAYDGGDYLFDGSMEGDFDRAYPVFQEFVAGMQAGGDAAQRMRHALIVKTHRIAEDPSLAAQRIARQLNLGVSGIMFVGVESADEVKQGLAAMRFKSHGGTRPDDVGSAPAYWGLSETEYREKADLWPLNPNGELVNWTIVESKEGLAHVREIAAVPGIGVLWPGAGTLRGVFTTTDANGQRTFDEQGWEAAIQQVLSACKEFHVPCGYPATANDIEKRMQQGFSVFVINWGDAGFQAVDIGKKAAGRTGGR